MDAYEKSNMSEEHLSEVENLLKDKNRLAALLKLERGEEVKVEEKKVLKKAVADPKPENQFIIKKTDKIEKVKSLTGL